MKRNVVMVVAVTIIVIASNVLPVAANGIEGYWCRNVNNVVGDIMSITSSGDVSKVNLREGWDRPIYSEGIGSLNRTYFTVTLRSKTQPNTIVHVVIKVSGNSASYTSYNMDGSFRWKGDYYRCNK